MAVGGNVIVPQVSSLPLDCPLLLLSGDTSLPFAEVNTIVDSASILHPGRATVTVRNIAAVAEQGFLTLTKNAVTALPGFSRVRIISGRDGSTAFIGNLLKPKHSWNSHTDAMVLQYEDDRHWLRKIPMRGGFVFDTQKGKTVFLNSYDPHLNPEGYQNCCFTTAGNMGPLPAGEFPYLFTQIAAQGTWGINDDSVVGVGDENNVAPGDAVCWTPLRWLQYVMAFCVYELTTGNDPLEGKFARLDPKKISFKVNLPSNVYTMRKMPDMSFKNKNAAQALHAFEEVCSAYGLRLQYNDDGTSTVTTYIKRADLVTEKRVLFVQTSGSPTFQSVWKAEVESDYTDTVTDTLVEPGRPHIEAEFVWTGDPSTSSLIPAWGTVGSDGKWSRFGDSASPNKSTELDFMYIVALAQDINGTAIPGLVPGSLAALSLARACYPKVFRAYKLWPNSATGQRMLATIMAGVPKGTKGSTTDLSQYPWLGWLRPFLEEQLQPYIEYSSSGVGTLKRATQRVPLRIQLLSACQPTPLSPVPYTGTDVGYNNGVRPEKDGFIYFDGLTDDVQVNLIYQNLIRAYSSATIPTLTTVNVNDTTYPKQLGLLVNAAIVHDGLPGQKLAINNNGGDPNNIKAELDPSVVGQAQPLLQHYIQNPAFKTEHQVNSKPAMDSTLTMVTLQSDGSIGAPTVLPIPATGITAELRSDYKQVTAHLQRRHQEMCRVRRTQKYVLPGVQYAWKAGDFVTNLVTSDGASFSVNDFIANIEHDYTGPEQCSTLHFGGGNVA